MKKLLNILTSVALLAGLIALLIFAENRHRQMPCSGFDVKLMNQPENQLITIDEVRDLIGSVKDSIIGTPVNAINMEQIFSKVQQHPYVLAADAYLSLNGKLHVRIYPRLAMARIINSDNKQMLMDIDGNIFPDHPSHPLSALVVNGYFANAVFPDQNEVILFDSIADDASMNDIFIISKHITSDPLYMNLIDQVYITDKGEYELIPKIGNQLIILGKPENLTSKMRKLGLVYEDILPAKGWDYYKTINLKFDNQIVCTK